MFLAILIKQSQQQIHNIQNWMEDNFFLYIKFPSKNNFINCYDRCLLGGCSQL